MSDREHSVALWLTLITKTKLLSEFMRQNTFTLLHNNEQIGQCCCGPNGDTVE
jgi:hypothetical protein